jgi:hypothetical protein
VDIEVLAVRNPRWQNETDIYCEIKTTHWNGWLPFSASPHDVAPHGRELFLELVTGKHGTIAPRNTDEPIPETSEQDPSTSVVFWPDINEFIQEANSESARGTSRGICLVWATMVEAALRQELASYHIRHGRKWNDFHMPGGKNYGYSFCDVIEVAAASTMLDATTQRHLHHIRNVRNVCAHQWRLDFSNPEVADLMQTFEALRDDLFPDLIINQDLAYLMKMVLAPAAAMVLLRLFAVRHGATAGDLAAMPRSIRALD